MLYEWEDEFDQHKADYFQRCVALDSSVGEENDTEVSPTISGLANVGTLDVSGMVIRPVSRVFTHHLWPKMAEVSFRGYVHHSRTEFIPYTMRLEQNAHHISGILKCILWIENIPILIQIALKLGPKCSVVSHHSLEIWLGGE